MIDALMVEGLVAAGCVGIALVAPRRSARMPRTPAPPPLSASLRELRRRRRREARAVVALAREIAARHAPGSPEAFTASETLGRYLPDTIAAYLAVPAALRRVRRAGGQSPDDELRRQFATLSAALERLREADAERATARMAANAAFLHERFGPPPREWAAQPRHARTVAAVRDIAEALGVHLRRA
jgi:hypothetical protein